jgi:hypothetical protein
VEPIDVARQEMAVVEASRPRATTPAASTDDLVRVSQKLMDNLYNFVMSFGTQPDAQGVPHIPLKIFQVRSFILQTHSTLQDWFTSTERKLRNDGSFLRQ